MTSANDPMTIWARQRLALALQEQALFSLGPQIRLQILLAIAADDGNLSVADIARKIHVTDVAIRSHMQDLKKHNYVAISRSRDDFRVKK